MQPKSYETLIKDRDIKIIECPRDAMQGLHDFVSTPIKAKYINKLLEVGFDTLDFGSFVSPKAIPQLRDTAEVLNLLDIDNSPTDLLAIVANLRGALNASQFPQIKYLGYPFSISETFQLRNTNATLEESLERVMDIYEITLAHNKELVIYISMGFGNPYGDTWNTEIVERWVHQLASYGIEIFLLSDTVGVAKPESIEYLFSELIPENPDLEIGGHFHTTIDTWEEKVHAAFANGCTRFDGTIKGYGGCPMAQNDLVGNMPSEFLIQYAQKHNLNFNLDLNAYKEAMKIAKEIFV